TDPGHPPKSGGTLQFFFALLVWAESANLWILEKNAYPNQKEGTARMRSPPPLALPAAATPRQILWPYAISLTTVHVLALLALIPWLFSWTGVILAVAGLYVFGTLGINLCYHRLLTHQSFSCPV